MPSSPPPAPPPSSAPGIGISGFGYGLGFGGEFNLKPINPIFVAAAFDYVNTNLTYSHEYIHKFHLLVRLSNG